MTQTPKAMQEEELVRAARHGDHRAFKRLYEIHVVPLFRFLSRFSHDREQVKEWSQRAFIKAFEHLPEFDGISLFSTWLFKLALNEMRMDHRRSKIISFVSIPEDDILSSHDESSEFHWNATMSTWLDQLDETKRAVFLLYEVEGYTHAEIADLLQIGESTSRTILSRAKHFLRQRWEEERKAI